MGEPLHRAKLVICRRSSFYHFWYRLRFRLCARGISICQYCLKWWAVERLYYPKCSSPGSRSGTAVEWWKMSHFLPAVITKDPFSYKQAKSGNYSEKRCSAIHFEMGSLPKNHTWILLLGDTAPNVLIAKSIFNIGEVCTTDGAVEWLYRAMLVTLGFQ